MGTVQDKFFLEKAGKSLNKWTNNETLDNEWVRKTCTYQNISLTRIKSSKSSNKGRM